MRGVDIAFGVAWLVFWVYWLAAAVNSKSSVTRSPQFIGVRVAVVVIVLVALRTNVLNARTEVVSEPALQAAGLALLVLGLATAIWARVHLGANWGMPMSEQLGAELVTEGPYRYVRHPIYSGILLAMIGTALAIGGVWVIVAALMGCYFIFSATVEERTMARLFPSKYAAYKRSTRMLVPFIL